MYAILYLINAGRISLFHIYIVVNLYVYEPTGCVWKYIYLMKRLFPYISDWSFNECGAYVNCHGYTSTIICISCYTYLQLINMRYFAIIYWYN